ncbi:TPA: LPXTG cell wall anchor domain-containing protein, partial [Streptococcus suis 92-1400]|uniref:LPXTG cell wall anchor domain-containing protein n=1 Tax=Streptococcus suis TaxID=1307 RepID=UPI000515F1EA
DRIPAGVIEEIPSTEKDSTEEIITKEDTVIEKEPTKISTQKRELPKTGDASHVRMYGICGVLSLVALVFVSRKKVDM